MCYQPACGCLPSIHESVEPAASSLNQVVAVCCLPADHDHWWSGCQIYGSTPERNRELRSGVDGKLKLANTGHVTSDGSYLPLDGSGVEPGRIQLQPLERPAAVALSFCQRAQHSV